MEFVGVAFENFLKNVVEKLNAGIMDPDYALRLVADQVKTIQAMVRFESEE